MSHLDDARREAELQLAWSRRQAEERLADVKAIVASGIGRVPKNASLLLVLLAAAGGFAFALRGRGPRGHRGPRGRRRSSADS